MPTLWPTLRPIDEDQPWWVDRNHLRALRVSCARIRARSRAEAFIDTRRRFVVFGYTRGNGAVDLMDITAPLYRAPGVFAGFDPVLDKFSEDEVCRVVGLARVPMRDKERWRAYAETTRQNDAAQEAGRRAEEKSPLVDEFLAKRHERRSMGRHYRGRAVVNGSKR